MTEQSNKEMGKRKWPQSVEIFLTKTGEATTMPDHNFDFKTYFSEEYLRQSIAKAWEEASNIVAAKCGDSFFIDTFDKRAKDARGEKEKNYVGTGPVHELY